LGNNRLQIAPGVRERLHGEPRVGIRPHVERLDLLVQLVQRVEVGVRRRQASLELRMRLAQGANLLDGVAAHRIRHVLLGVLEPGVEGGRLLGEGEIELLDLGELLLDLVEAGLARSAVRQQAIPTLDDNGVLLVDGGRLDVVGPDELVLQRGDVLDALRLEGLESDVEGLLLGEQRLDAGQVPSELVRADMRLLVRNPGLHHVGLPHELQVGGVVQQVVLAQAGQLAQVVHLVAQLLAALRDRIRVVIPLLDKSLSLLADVRAALPVHGQVRLEGVVLLDEPLNAGLEKTGFFI
jgi:hypothetical protein